MRRGFAGLVLAFMNASGFGQTLALTGGTIYLSPEAAPVHGGVVLVRDGKIAAVGTRAAVSIPQGTETIDCTGLTVAAGFWNSHVHFFERKWSNVGEIPGAEVGRQLQDMLTRFGFTSVFDTGSLGKNTRRLRDRIESGEVAGPRIRSTGEAMAPPNAMPSDTVLAMMGSMKFGGPEISDAATARAATRQLLEQGVDAIKLFASAQRGGALSHSTIQAAVEEAHRAGKLVFVHPNTGADVLTAVRGGVDIIAHTTPASGPWDETILSAMKEHGVSLIPTLTLWKYYARHDRISAQDKITETELGQLRAWIGRGGSVLFGTDIGAVEYDPSEECTLMAAAGMTFSQILASMTTAPAERFGDGRRLGRIAAGMAADLVVMRGDPGQDLRALTAVQFTLRDGKVIYRAGGR
jgi:imidazolonepropionase-like amidohydrolase